MIARARQNLHRIAAMLQDLAQNLAEIPSGPVQNMRAYHLICAQEELQRQIARRALFGRYGLLEDPTWDAIVRIFAAEMNGTPVSMREMVLEIGASEELTMRWLNLLRRMDLVEFEALVQKKDDVRLRLTQYSSAMMMKYFQEYYPENV